MMKHVIPIFLAAIKNLLSVSLCLSSLHSAPYGRRMTKEMSERR